MKLYVSGGMTGLLHSNFPAFDAATDKLRALGHEVFSPAEHDRELGITGEDDSSYVPTMLDLLGAWDIECVRTVDALFMLTGWELSKGARAEHAIAVWYGKKIFYESTIPGIGG